VLRDYADLQVAWAKVRDAAVRGDEPPITGLEMVDALAVWALARAALGDDTMMVQVADRLEGRPAVRSGEADEDPEISAERARSIEAIVRLLNDPSSTQPGDNGRVARHRLPVENLQLLGVWPRCVAVREPARSLLIAKLMPPTSEFEPDSKIEFSTLRR
jgi:hypothetical protein